MYTYTWYQWLLIFYTYCFFGWIFESTYVSCKTRRFVNRGFLRLPMLPLYGTGAVMMLWVSLPLEHNVFLVYISGMIAATVLEYVTGWGMEKLFKMKYWDYSNQRFNLNGYICLSSSVAWGFLTIFLTEIVHPPISRLVLLLHPIPALITVGAVTVMFTADAVQSVRAAQDLAKVLDAMTKMRAELDDSGHRQIPPPVRLRRTIRREFPTELPWTKRPKRRLRTGNAGSAWPLCPSV